LAVAEGHSAAPPADEKEKRFSTHQARFDDRDFNELVSHFQWKFVAGILRDHGVQSSLACDLFLRSSLRWLGFTSVPIHERYAVQRVSINACLTFSDLGERDLSRCRAIAAMTTIA
jgi:hypothetical protein